MAEQPVALLVDGDNVPPFHAAQLLATATRLGRVDVARVYANICRAPDWIEVPGVRLMLAGSSKNAADMLLALDAIELALAAGIAEFVIATSDRDFTHVAQRLRERGARVTGLGEARTPPEFRAACTRFELLVGEVQGRVCKGAGYTAFDLSIRAMIARHGQGRQGMRLADLAPQMHRTHGTRISTRPEGTWRHYLQARPELYDLDPRGPEAKVRCIPAGFAGA
ncbi:NYN domain-containing protein [Mesobacterium pallidum]|uniref:NYN domain-containing protein n=1 Tax=Mesobacterium pallidum TaxID=2872037 RepID=UPI001EE29FF5|nr:NYN domain-containing protein [Mesobacterium pallidum]